eukprot:XP_001693101.1 predicted protein [Chlamydomonas reinhardtii]
MLLPGWPSRPAPLVQRSPALAALPSNTEPGLASPAATTAAARNSEQPSNHARPGSTRPSSRAPVASSRPPAPRSVLGEVRGAGLQQWVELVRLYSDPAGAEDAAAAAAGTGARRRKGSGLGGVFAADALFRAAHFVDGDGKLHSNPLESWRTHSLAPKAAGAAVASAAAAAANIADLPRGAPAAQLIDAVAFSELVQQLLPDAADAAEAGQLGSVRGARLLWALAKLSASPGAAESTGEGPGQPQRERQGKGPTISSAAPLPRAAMRQHGERCAVALAAQLLREAWQAQQQQPGAASGDAPAPAPLIPTAAGPARANTPATTTTADASFMSSGRNVVMVMWALARLSAAGFLPRSAGSSSSGSSAAGAGSVHHGDLWQALSAALLPYVPGPASSATAATAGSGLPARELSNALWALATVRKCGAAVFPALVAAMEAHLAAAGAAPVGAVPVAGGRCNAQDIANTVWALARAGTDPEARVMRLAEGAVLRAAPQLRAQHVASLLWSFGVLRYSPALRPQALAVPSGSGGSDRGGGRGSGRVADLYSVLGQRAGELRMWWSGEEDQLAQVVWSLVRMHEPPARTLVTPPLLAAAAERLAAGAARLSLREAAMVASAYRDARFAHPPLFAALLKRACELPERELGGAGEGPDASASGGGAGSPHADVSIALLLRGLAWAGAYDPVVYTRLCSALRRHHLAAISPQPLAMTLWALARVQHRQPEFLASATFVATAIVGRFRGGELATAALALATLGVRSAAFFDAAAELANVMAAFATSGHVDEMLYYRAQTPLLSDLAARVRQLLWRLEPRDIASLAWALATSRLGLEGCADLLDRAVSAAGTHAPAFSPRELATVAWAAASCGRRDDRLMAACERVVLSWSHGQAAEHSARTAGCRGQEGAAEERRRSLRGVGAGDRVVASSVDEDDDESGGAALFPGPLPGGAGAADSRPGGAGGAGRAAAGLTLQPDLQHVVALLEAFAVWAAGAASTGAGTNANGADTSGEEGQASCYDDALFRAAARVLLARADELTNEEVVTVAWCCAMVLHQLPRPAPAPARPHNPPAHQQLQHPLQHAHGGANAGVTGAGADEEAEHPVVLLLGSLSGLLGGMRPDSFLQPELVQLAQARAASREQVAAPRPATAIASPPKPAPAAPQRNCISDPGNAPAPPAACAQAATVVQPHQVLRVLICNEQLNRTLSPWASGEATVSGAKRVNTAGGFNGAPERTVDRAMVTLTGSAACKAAAAGVGQSCVLADGRPAVQVLAAVKTVTATLTPTEAHLLKTYPAAASLALLPSVKLLGQELEAYTKTMKRATDVHGAHLAQRCFLRLYGWELVCTGPDTYALRSYWQWQQHGSLREYLIRCLEHPDIRMGRTMLIAALQEVLQLMHKLSRAGIVLGDLKLDNMLVDAHGHVTLSDHLVGASLGALLAAIQPLLLAAGRTACFYFVTELNGLAMGLQTLAHTNRPDLQSVWSQLEAIGARRRLPLSSELRHPVTATGRTPSPLIWLPPTRRVPLYSAKPTCSFHSSPPVHTHMYSV